MPSKVIGEGTYGCVHNPPLSCKGNRYKKLVEDQSNISKLMLTTDANKEMTEYDLIDSVDKKKEFFLGIPDKCNIADTTMNRAAIDRCGIAGQVYERYNNYSLLLMKNGGINLETFAHKMHKLPRNAENVNKMELFWLEVHRLMIGLRTFIRNDIVHHDMKHQNIVYDEKNNRLTFIDFGLMTTKTKLIRDAYKSVCWLSRAHWSFPLEIEFINKKEYKEFSSKTARDKNRYAIQISNDFKKQDKDTDVAYVIPIFFSMISCSNPTPVIKDCEKRFQFFFQDYVRMLNDMEWGPHEYDDFLEKLINTIDSYGLGMSLMYVLRHTSHLISESFAQELNHLFYHMYHPVQAIRLDIDNIIAQYEECLGKNGILTKFKKQFINNELVPITEATKKLEKVISSIKVSDIRLSPEELSKATLTIERKCPDGKEINLKTARCVKKCNIGFARNPAFRCVKVKKTRSISSAKKVKTQSQKKCVSGKELNPKTRRCINICKPGYIRNEKFKCRKQKTRKN